MKIIIITIIVIFLALPALAQRDSVSDALTGANPTAPQTTGVGQAVTPIIQSPLSPAPATKRELETTVPYPQAPRPGEGVRTKGSYYGEDVKTGGEYYPEGVRVKGQYQAPSIPPTEVKPAVPVTPRGVPPATPTR